jgi:capsular polysaccharide biosynthesis protein
VTADPTATIVEFKVSYHTKQGAVALTNAYAQAFAEYRKQQTTASRNKLVAGAQDLAWALINSPSFLFNR